MAEEKKEAQYAKPASQLDLEARQEKDNASDRVLSTADSYEASADDEGGRDFAVEGNDTEGYIGANPEYRTYANETEAPLKADEDSAEQKVADYFVDTMNTEAVKPGEQDSSESDKKEEAPKVSASKTETKAPAKSSGSSS